MAAFAKQTKQTLVAYINVTELSIFSGKFEFIKPSGATGEFTAVVDSVNSRIFYKIETIADIDEIGDWSIWASYIDSSGDINRTETSIIDFLNPDQ